MAANLLGNILIFVPYGFFVSMARQDKRIFQDVFLQYVPEPGRGDFQLITRVGSFDVDDILLNTIGGVLGYIAFVLCNGIRRKHHVRKEKSAEERRKLREEKKKKIRPEINARRGQREYFSCISGGAGFPFGADASCMRLWNGESSGIIGRAGDRFPGAFC